MKLIEIYRYNESGELIKFPVFPWSGRSEQKWQRSVNRSEAARLFSLVCEAEGVQLNEVLAAENGLSPNCWISKWDLGTPFNVYWQGDIHLMMADLKLEAEKNKNAFQTDKETLRFLTEQCGAIFSDRRLFQYLITAHDCLETRGERVKRGVLKSPNPSLTVYQEAANILGWNDKILDEVLIGYQTLVEVFWPIMKSLIHGRGDRINDEQDWEGIAAEKLSISVVQHYWEPFVVNPRQTINAFLGRVFLSFQIHRPPSDASNLAVLSSRQFDWIAEQSDGVESQALENLSSQHLEAVIHSLVQSPTEKEIVLLRLRFLTLPEIAACVGLSKSTINRVLAKFKVDLSEWLKADGADLDIILPQRFQKGMVHRLDRFKGDFFPNIEKYRRLFEERAYMLKLSHRRVLAAFFTRQTGERKTTIQIISHDLSWSKASVRRHIELAFDIISGRRENPGNKGFQRRGTRNIRNEATIIRQARANPVVWGCLSEIEQRVLDGFFPASSESKEQISQTVLAEKLGIAPYTVSRKINYGIQKLYRLMDNSKRTPSTYTQDDST